MTENKETNRLIGELTGKVETLVAAFKTLQDICTMQGRHDERIGALERFRAGVWAVGLVMIGAIVKIAMNLWGK